MMFADPGGMHADFIGIDRLIADLHDELVRGALVARIVIVAEREIAKFHFIFPGALTAGRRRQDGLFPKSVPEKRY
jgi:hypothetical protein